MRFHQAGMAEQDLDPVALVEAVAGAHLLGDHRVSGAQQVGELDDDLIQGVLEQRIAAVVREQLDVVPKGLAGDGPPVGAAAADLGVGLDHGDPLPGLGQLHGRALAGGPGADDNGIDGLDGHSLFSHSLRKPLGYTTPVGGRDACKPVPGLAPDPTQQSAMSQRAGQRPPLAWVRRNSHSNRNSRASR